MYGNDNALCASGCIREIRVPVGCSTTNICVRCVATIFFNDFLQLVGWEGGGVPHTPVTFIAYRRLSIKQISNSGRLSSTGYLHGLRYTDDYQ